MAAPPGQTIIGEAQFSLPLCNNVEGKGKLMSQNILSWLMQFHVGVLIYTRQLSLYMSLNFLNIPVEEGNKVLETLRDMFDLYDLIEETSFGVNGKKHKFGQHQGQKYNLL